MLEPLHLQNDESAISNRLAQEWLKTGSLEDTAAALLSSDYRGDMPVGYDSYPLNLLALLSKESMQRSSTLEMLAKAVQDKNRSPASARLAFDIAAEIGKTDRTALIDKFIKPTFDLIGNSSLDYRFRLSSATELGRLIRSGRAGDLELRLPDLRMPALEISNEKQSKLRADMETALRDSSKLQSLLGDGELGQLFPAIFGSREKGGILGREQAGIHEFTVDVHTLKVLEAVRQHPEYSRLSPVDQTNLLWAALLHDTGKREGIVDPGHEWVSANLAHGVLASLGYPPERIQRISNLISRHSELSYDPKQKQSEILTNSRQYAQDLATFYRHPSALRQLNILNESDIRSLNSGSTFWTAEAKAEIARIQKLIASENPGAGVPLLTSSIPRGFALHSLSGDYAVLAHTSQFLETSFLKQLALIESPDYSISASLLTGKHQHLFAPEASLVVLLTGPSERIAQVGRENLSTGTEVNWQRHVELSRNQPAEMRSLLNEVDAALRARASTSGGSSPANLRELWQKLSQYSSLSELQARGSTDPLVIAHQSLLKALSTDGSGNPLTAHNEIKLNSPTVTGIGIVRRGRNVHFEGMSEKTARMLFGERLPSWYTSEFGAGPSRIVVPSSVWMEALKKQLPIVSLD